MSLGRLARLARILSLSLFILVWDLTAQEPKPADAATADTVADTAPILTEAQRLELAVVQRDYERAEKAVYKIDSEYAELRKRAMEAVQKADESFNAVVKRLQALAPVGYQLTYDGTFKKSTPQSPSPEKGKAQ